MECALAGVPPIAFHRVHPLSAVLAAPLLHSPHLALPNLVLGARVYPELVQHNADPRRLCRETLDLLHDPARRRALRTQGVALRLLLNRGGPSSAERTAAAILEGMFGVAEALYPGARRSCIQ